MSYRLNAYLLWESSFYFIEKSSSKCIYFLTNYMFFLWLQTNWRTKLNHIEIMFPHYYFFTDGRTLGNIKLLPNYQVLLCMDFPSRGTLHKKFQKVKYKSFHEEKNQIRSFILRSFAKYIFDPIAICSENCVPYLNDHVSSILNVSLHSCLNHTDEELLCLHFLLNLNKDDFLTLYLKISFSVANLKYLWT